MAQALRLYFDAEAAEAFRALWRRLETAGITAPSGRERERQRPHVTLAAASVLPTAARKAVAGEFDMLTVPDLWFHLLGAPARDERCLLLGAIADTELIALHSAVHDSLAGKVTNPSADHLPGAWLPSCVLAEALTHEQVSAGFAALHPQQPIRASITEIGLADTRTGETEVLARPRR